MLTFVTANSFNDVVPERCHSKYHGTSRGDAFGFVILPSLADAWSLTFHAKRAVYGRRLVATGAEFRSHLRGNKLEPVFYNGWPASFYENMFTVMSACAVIDCTAGSGEAAKAAVHLQLPYVGICLTEGHAVGLTHHLVEWVLQSFKTEGNTLYRSQFADSHHPPTDNMHGMAKTLNDPAKPGARKTQLRDAVLGKSHPVKKMKGTDAPNYVT